MEFIRTRNKKAKTPGEGKGRKITSITVAKYIVMLLIVSMVAQIGVVSAVALDEQIINSFTASKNGQAVINNLQYTDLSNESHSLKDAVYQNGALGIFPSLGNVKFNPNGYISKEMALYLAYMAANRAEEITTQGQALNAVRTADQKKTSLQAVLFDGSLQLAANEGLITQQELTQALQVDQTALVAGDFKRSSAVQRQEFATWLAKALMLPPVYEQQELFNSYSDWKIAKPENAQYIEAILQGNIMSGDTNGRFNPTQGVTRQQAARILKNAENVILPLRSMEKRTATIEELNSIKDSSKGYTIDYKKYIVRNSDGMLDEITVEAQYQKPTTTTNEITKVVQPTSRTEIPVFRDGQIQSSKSLKTGDRIEYIVNVNDSTVRYARVLSNNGEIDYKAAILNSTNNTARTMNITPLTQKVNYPNEEVNNPQKEKYSDGSTVYETYSYVNNLVDAVTKASVDATTIKPESIVILGIKQNMIVEVRPITIKKEREQGLISGIVEESNPQLGYITLYNDDGTGKTPLEMSKLRTFNYADPNAVEVYKNHLPAELEDIEAGDTVFIRIAEDGEVSSISSVPNYTVRYGKVISKKISSLTVETDKGRQLEYATDGAEVIKDGKLSKLNQIKAGDRVKLLINEAPNATIVKEITVGAGDKLVANIYKGKFVKYDDISGKLKLSDPWTLRNGTWTKDANVAFKTIELGDNFTAYYDGEKEPVKKLNTYMNDMTVYIASEKDYGNGENGVLATFVNGTDKEVNYNDKIYTTTSSNNFTLEKALSKILYNPGTIVIKDGRLVQGSSVSANDYAYVMANRDAGTNEIVAGVISIEERPGVKAVQLYRGRIKSIDEYKAVTLESYSKLNGVNWDYANTPMTFTLSADTRITDTDGITGQGDFNSYSGANTFKGRTVYVLADDTNAVEISTAPFGNVNVSGEVASISGGSIDDEGNVVTEPSTIALRNCKYYNATSKLWVSMSDSSLTLLSNSFVLKNNERISPSTLKKGDKLRILKKDSTTGGDAYIVIVEE